VPEAEEMGRIGQLAAGASKRAPHVFDSGYRYPVQRLLVRKHVSLSRINDLCSSLSSSSHAKYT